MRLLFLSLFILLSIDLSSQIVGGSGVCEVSSDPNTITKIQSSDGNICKVVYFAGNYYRYNPALTAGSRWYIDNTIINPYIEGADTTGFTITDDGIIFDTIIFEVGGGGGIATELDPTVPSYVKSISTTDITNWNNDNIGLDTSGAYHISIDTDLSSTNELDTVVFNPYLEGVDTVGFTASQHGILDTFVFEVGSSTTTSSDPIWEDTLVGVGTGYVKISNDDRGAIVGQEGLWVGGDDFVVGETDTGGGIEYNASIGLTTYSENRPSNAGVSMLRFTNEQLFQSQILFGDNNFTGLTPSGIPQGGNLAIFSARNIVLDGERRTIVGDTLQLNDHIVDVNGNAGTNGQVLIRVPSGVEWKNQRVIITLASDFSSTANNTNSTVTGMTYTFPETGTYKIKMIGGYTSSETTNGCRMRFEFPTSPTNAFGKLECTINATSGTIRGVGIGNIGEQEVISSGVSPVTENHYIGGELIIDVSANNTMELRWGSEVNGDTSTLKAGSKLIIEKL